jgi:hypothetical protein
MKHYGTMKRSDGLINAPPDREDLDHKPKYSGSDGSMMYGDLNRKRKINEDQHGSSVSKAEKSLVNETGCILKEPLT